MSDDGRTVNINQISALCPSDDGLWIGTRSRGALPLPALRRTDPLHLRRREFHLGKPHHGDLRRQPQTHPDRHLGRGLNVFDPETERFTIVTHNEGLHDNTVCSAVEDRKGRLWVITRTGISELDASNRVLRTYDHSGGIRVQEFSPASAFVTDDNTVWVGGDSGLVSFNPDNLHVNTYAPPVVITSVAVNNRPSGRRIRAFDGPDAAAPETRREQPHLRIQRPQLHLPRTQRLLLQTRRRRQRMAVGRLGARSQLRQSGAGELSFPGAGFEQRRHLERIGHHAGDRDRPTGVAPLVGDNLLPAAAGDGGLAYLPLRPRTPPPAAARDAQTEARKSFTRPASNSSRTSRTNCGRR